MEKRICPVCYEKEFEIDIKNKLFRCNFCGHTEPIPTIED